MGFLGDIVGDALGNVFAGGRTDKKLARLIAEGERVTGTLDGIRIESDGDSGEKHTYSVSMTGPLGLWRASVRQQLRPHGDRVRLGMPVQVAHLDGAIGIDWPTTVRELGLDVLPDTPFLPIKTLKEPLPPGIEDFRVDRKRLERGRRTEARVVAAEPVVVLGMPTQNVDLDVVLPDENDRAVRLGRALIPGYATGLLVPGTELPVAIDPKKPDRVTVDWVLAATRAAGR